MLYPTLYVFHEENTIVVEKSPGRTVVSQSDHSLILARIYSRIGVKTVFVG